MKRRGNFIGWPCVRVAWRWNAVGVFQYRLRFTADACERDLAGVRARNGRSWRCAGVANDVSAWWCR